MPRLVTLNDRADGGDARVLALQTITIRLRLEPSHECRPEFRGGARRDEVEHARKFDDAQRVCVHGRKRP